MNWEQYRIEAKRTMNFELSRSEQLLAGAFGLAGEAGELIDQIKKIQFHGHAVDRDEIQKEAGDIFWYVALVAEALDLPTRDLEQAIYDDARRQTHNDKRRLFTSVLRLSEDVGEISKRIRIYNNVITSNPHRTSDYLGRIITDVNVILMYYGLTPSIAREVNIAKLRERYPKGFSSERSINREQEEL